MRDLRDKYDELDNIISSINILIDDIGNKDYIDSLNEIKYQAMNEIEEVEKELQKEQEEDIAELNREYVRSVI